VDLLRTYVENAKKVENRSFPIMMVLAGAWDDRGKVERKGNESNGTGEERKVGSHNVENREG